MYMCTHVQCTCVVCTHVHCTHVHVMVIIDYCATEYNLFTSLVNGEFDLPAKLSVKIQEKLV